MNKVGIKNIIQVENVSKDYVSEAGVQHVLNDVEFTINKGDFIGIVGDSGSGKTTLLNLLGALDCPTKGKIRILGSDIDKMDDSSLSYFRRNHIGFVFQDYNLIEELTVYENIMFSAQLKGIHVKKQVVDKLMHLFRLDDKKDKFPAQLSGGEKQRVAILRSVVSIPDVILADEPTGNLDKKNTSAVVQLLKFINEKWGVTILMVTHNDRLTAACNRVIQVEDGRLKENTVFF